jgi:hypothetical protein
LVYNEQPFKELTSDKTGHTEKKVVTKSTRNLFSLSRKYAARKIESDVTPLWKEEYISSSCKDK